MPRNDELIIEGKIDPRDVEQVQVGADALVRVMAGEQRANPDLNGKVTLVSADLTHDRPAAGTPERAYYTVRVSLAKEEVARLGELKLLPGMQAEIFVQTYPRTPLQYLMKPLKDQMARAFRER